MLREQLSPFEGQVRDVDDREPARLEKEPMHYAAVGTCIILAFTEFLADTGPDRDAPCVIPRLQFALLCLNKGAGYAL